MVGSAFQGAEVGSAKALRQRARERKSKGLGRTEGSAVQRAWQDSWESWKLVPPAPGFPAGQCVAVGLWRLSQASREEGKGQWQGLRGLREWKPQAMWALLQVPGSLSPLPLHSGPKSLVLPHPLLGREMWLLGVSRQASWRRRLLSCLILLWFPLTQFEDGILDTCLMLLDINPKFLKDSCRDCSRRSSPVYVGRVVSGMVSGRVAGPPPAPAGSSLLVVQRWCPEES